MFFENKSKNFFVRKPLYNERRQKDSIKLFEFSKIYSNDDQLNDVFKIGIIASGRRGHNYLDFSKNIDKNYLAEIFSSYFDHENINELSRENLDSKVKARSFMLRLG